VDTNNCTPLVNALVDIWHCDAMGVYSHYIAASQGIPGVGNDNETFFRGMLFLFSNYLIDRFLFFNE
jgi:protocatechuate 3,4-dioxygenase beta subunit